MKNFPKQQTVPLLLWEYTNIDLGYEKSFKSLFPVELYQEMRHLLRLGLTKPVFSQPRFGWKRGQLRRRQV